MAEEAEEEKGPKIELISLEISIPTLLHSWLMCFAMHACYSCSSLFEVFESLLPCKCSRVLIVMYDLFNLGYSSVKFDVM